MKTVEEGVAPNMRASERELIMMVVQMHLACKARRRSESSRPLERLAFSAYEQGENGLQVAQGERWEGLPLMCSKQTTGIVQERLNWRTARKGH